MRPNRTSDEGMRPNQTSDEGMRPNHETADERDETQPDLR